jgi:hypothetical protein
MANLALNRPRWSQFASPLQLSFEPILFAAHLLAQPNYGDNTCHPGFGNNNSKTVRGNLQPGGEMHPPNPSLG